MPKKSCEVDDCDNDARARGMCIPHWKRWRKGATPEEVGRPLRRRQVCCLDGCDAEVFTAHEKPLCGSHKHRRLTGNYGPVRPDGDACTFEGCDKPRRTMLLCSGHYAQQRRGGPLKPLWRPERRTINAQGYVLLYRPGEPGATKHGRIMEHRHVMQQALGRPLERHENVHHRNGDRADNRLENLELWSTMQPTGQRVIDKIEWAREVLAMYAEVDESLLGA